MSVPRIRFLTNLILFPGCQIFGFFIVGADTFAKDWPEFVLDRAEADGNAELLVWQIQDRSENELKMFILFKF